MRWALAVVMGAGLLGPAALYLRTPPPGPVIEERACDVCTARHRDKLRLREVLGGGDTE